MNMKRTLIVGVLAALVVVGGGVAVYAAVDRPPKYEYVEKPGVVDDWCAPMDREFGSKKASPSVEATAKDIVAGKATSAVAYLTLLEGEPREILWAYTIVRTAGDQVGNGEPVTDPDAVLKAAAAIDDYRAKVCS